jgi:hypothetical protein
MMRSVKYTMTTVSCRASTSSGKLRFRCCGLDDRLLLFLLLRSIHCRRRRFFFGSRRRLTPSPPILEADDDQLNTQPSNPISRVTATIASLCCVVFLFEPSNDSNRRAQERSSESNKTAGKCTRYRWCPTILPLAPLCRLDEGREIRTFLFNKTGK